MIRLFLDTMDFSDPTNDGWTIIRPLIKSLSKESTPLASNTIMWFLQQSKAENVITFGPRTIWHGLQHATRSFLHHTNEDEVLQRLGDPELDSSKKMFSKSHAISIARWVALRLTGRRNLPMLIIASSISHFEGFDWIGDGPEPDRPMLEKQLPFLYRTWSDTLKDGLERAEELMATELESTFEQAAWTSDFLRQVYSGAPQSDESSSRQSCANCSDDYTELGTGLIEPFWIAFADCMKSDHRFSCSCSKYSRSYIADKIFVVQLLPENQRVVMRQIEMPVFVNSQTRRAASLNVVLHKWSNKKVLILGTLSCQIWVKIW